MGSNTAKMLDSEATIKGRSAVSIYALSKTGLPHTQDNSGYFEILENLRVTQDILTFF